MEWAVSRHWWEGQRSTLFNPFLGNVWSFTVFHNTHLIDAFTQHRAAKDYGDNRGIMLVMLRVLVDCECVGLCWWIVSMPVVLHAIFCQWQLKPCVCVHSIGLWNTVVAVLVFEVANNVCSRDLNCRGIHESVGDWPNLWIIYDAPIFPENPNFTKKKPEMYIYNLPHFLLS